MSLRAGHLRFGHGSSARWSSSRARGLTFEAEGALWLRTTQFGDDKDRVLRKSDGSFTYLVPDIAYHIDKHERGFDRVIDVWGADHHGYIPRMRAVLSALGYPPEFFDVALVQLVKVVRGGEEVKMSKRSGEFVTLRDLYEEVGVDAARYFFLMRKGASPLDFDVDLAKRQTDENPVFYVQMAHARLSGIFRTAERSPEQRRPATSTWPRCRRRRTSSCSRSWRPFPRSWTRRPASASRTASRSTSTSWPPRCTAGTTTPAPSARRKGPRPSRRGSCSPGRPGSSWPTPLPCWASPPPTGCDLMSLLVVGSIALDSIFTPFGETADALGGSAVYFSVAGSLLHPVQVVGVVGNDYPIAELERLAPRGIDWSGVERADGESFRWKGKYSYDLQSRETLETRLGVFADFQPKLPDAFRSRRIRLPREHRSRAAARRAGAGDAAVAGRVRHHELLDPEQEGGADGAAGAGGRAHGERQRGPRAERGLEHPSRRPLDSGPRPHARGDQAGRARRAAHRADPHVLRAGLPARERVRPHRRRRRLRRRVHGLPGAHRVVSEDNIRRAMVDGATMGSYAVEQFGIGASTR